jgi:WD40 repeat protein
MNDDDFGSDSTFALQRDDAELEQIADVLVREHGEWLLILGAAVYDDPAAAVDFTTGVFGRAIRLRSSYQGEQSVRAWLAYIGYTQINWRRLGEKQYYLKALQGSSEQPLPWAETWRFRLLRALPRRKRSQQNAASAVDQAAHLQREWLKLDQPARNARISQAALENNRQRLSPEFLLVAIFLLLAAGAVMYNRADLNLDQGVPLFPTSTASPAPSLHISIDIDQIFPWFSPSTDRWWQGATLSADGRFVSFQSAYPSERVIRRFNLYGMPAAFRYGIDSAKLDELSYRLSESGVYDFFTFSSRIGADGDRVLFQTVGDVFIVGGEPITAIDLHAGGAPLFLSDSGSEIIAALLLPHSSEKGSTFITEFEWTSRGNAIVYELRLKPSTNVLPEYCDLRLSTDGFVTAIFHYDIDLDQATMLEPCRALSLVGAPLFISEDGNTVAFTQLIPGLAIAGFEPSYRIALLQIRSGQVLDGSEQLRSITGAHEFVGALSAPGDVLIYARAAPAGEVAELYAFDLMAFDVRSGQHEVLYTDVYAASSIHDKFHLLSAASADISDSGQIVAFAYEESMDCRGCLAVYRLDRALNERTNVISDNQHESDLLRLDLSGDGLRLLVTFELTTRNSIYPVNSAGRERSYLFGRNGAVILELNDAELIHELSSPPIQHQPLDYLRSGTTHVEYSPGADLLAAGDADGAISVWVGKSDQPLYRLDANLEPVLDLKFSPNWNETLDQFILASGHLDGRVILWQVSRRTGTWRFSLDDHPGPIQSLAFSLDGTQIAVGHALGITIWQLNRQTATKSDEIWVGSVAALDYGLRTLDGPGLLFAAVDNAGLMILDQTELIATIGLDHQSNNSISEGTGWGATQALRLSPNGRVVAIGDHRGHVLIADVSWDIGARVTLAFKPRVIIIGQNPIQALEFNNSGEVLAVGQSAVGRSQGTGFRLFNLLARSQINFPGQSLPLDFTPDVFDLAFSADDLSLAVSLSGAIIRFQQDDTNPQPSQIPEPEPDQIDYEFFDLAAFNQYQVEQIVLTGTNEPVQPDLAQQPIGYPLALATESSPTSLYVRPPQNLPAQSHFIAQVDTGRTTVALIYDLPIFDDHEARLITHFSNGTRPDPIQPTDFQGRQVGAEAVIDQFAVGGLFVERLYGTWLYSPAEEPFLAKEDHYAIATWTVQWQPNPAWQMVRWQQDGVLYELVIWPKDALSPNGELPSLDWSALVNILTHLISVGPYPDN